VVLLPPLVVGRQGTIALRTLKSKYQPLFCLCVKNINHQDNKSQSTQECTAIKDINPNSLGSKMLYQKNSLWTEVCNEEIATVCGGYDYDIDLKNGGIQISYNTSGQSIDLNSTPVNFTASLSLFFSAFNLPIIGSGYSRTNDSAKILI
jgi:hypothetical protein